jgi:nucleoside permease NupC
MQNLQSAFGVFALLGIAWIISEDRRAVAGRRRRSPSS